jgi:hypothetical protein
MADGENRFWRGNKTGGKQKIGRKTTDLSK